MPFYIPETLSVPTYEKIRKNTDFSHENLLKYFERSEVAEMIANSGLSKIQLDILFDDDYGIILPILDTLLEKLNALELTPTQKSQKAANILQELINFPACDDETIFMEYFQARGYDQESCDELKKLYCLLHNTKIISTTSNQVIIDNQEDDQITIEESFATDAIPKILNQGNPMEIGAIENVKKYVKEYLERSINSYLQKNEQKKSIVALRAYSSNNAESKELIEKFIELAQQSTFNEYIQNCFNKHLGESALLEIQPVRKFQKEMFQLISVFHKIFNEGGFAAADSQSNYFSRQSPNVRSIKGMLDVFKILDNEPVLKEKYQAFLELLSSAPQNARQHVVRPG